MQLASATPALPWRPPFLPHSPIPCTTLRRLPDRPGAKPPALDVQFAPSLSLHGDELLIGIGVGDCHSGEGSAPSSMYICTAVSEHPSVLVHPLCACSLHSVVHLAAIQLAHMPPDGTVHCTPFGLPSELVRVPAFRARLASWLHSGMGTQLGSGPALQLPLAEAQPTAYPGQQAGGLAGPMRSPSLVRWEAPIFSDTQERWAAAAAAIGSRWAADPAINATARLVLRHLDRPDAGWGTPREVGGLPVIDSNQQNGLIPDVATSHAGCEGGDMDCWGMWGPAQASGWPGDVPPYSCPPACYNSMAHA